MQSTLAKYKIGLAVIGVFTLIVTFMVLSQANNTKQDTNTYNKASAAADKLNTYTAAQGVPASLATAGVKDVPDTVSYTKLSEQSYQFCVTYKSASTDFDPSAVGSNLLTSSVTGSATDSTAATEANSGYLYISPTHDKGKHCQTVKVQSYYGSSTPASNCTYDYNNPDQNAASSQYYACIGNTSGASSSPTITN